MPFPWVRLGWKMAMSPSLMWASTMLSPDPWAARPSGAAGSDEGAGYLEKAAFGVVLAPCGLNNLSVRPGISMAYTLYIAYMMNEIALYIA
jgi:hypothetical protein